MAYVNDIHSSPYPLRWRHNERNDVSNHQPHDCLLNFLFRRRSKKTSKLRATGLCAGNSPVPGEFPAQRVSNAENVFIWWRNHAMCILQIYCLMCRVLVESSHDYHSLSRAPRISSMWLKHKGPFHLWSEIKKFTVNETELQLRI